MKTSCSDNGNYPRFCEQASADDAVFATFRSNPVYRQVVETCGRNTGMNYKVLALQKYPEITRYFEKFAASERVGSPRVFDYDAGGETYSFAPVTLRYINVLADLVSYFGSLDGYRIVEIGGGYGGQCKIIRDMFNIEHYTLVDLPPAVSLARKYLSHYNDSGVSFVSSDELCLGNTRFDLVISNYAFSELSRSVQEVYWERIVTQSRSGYMLCNFASHTWDRNQFTEKEMNQALGGVNSETTSPPLAQIDVSCGVTLLWW